MKKLLKICIWFIFAAIVFFAGFYIGTIDTKDKKITITSQCTGIGIEKTFSANYERIGNNIIKNEKNNSEKYTTRCLCYASDATHKNIWVDAIEFSDVSEDSVHKKCASECQELCEKRLNKFTFVE